MPPHAVQPPFMVPSLMKSLEDMNDLTFVEAVEMGNHGIEFMYHVFLFILWHRPTCNADLFCPFREPTVRTCQAPCKCYDSPPFRVVGGRTGYRKRVDDEVIEICLNKTPCIPVERN